MYLVFDTETIPVASSRTMLEKFSPKMMAAFEQESERYLKNECPPETKAELFRLLSENNIKEYEKLLWRTLPHGLMSHSIVGFVDMIIDKGNTNPKIEKSWKITDYMENRGETGVVHAIRNTWIDGIKHVLNAIQYVINNKGKVVGFNLNFDLVALFNTGMMVGIPAKEMVFIYEAITAKPWSRPKWFVDLNEVYRPLFMPKAVVNLGTVAEKLGFGSSKEGDVSGAEVAYYFWRSIINNRPERMISDAEDISKYCEADTAITEKLYLYAVENMLLTV